MAMMLLPPEARNRTGEETVAPLLGDVTVMLVISPEAVGGGAEGGAGGGGGELPAVGGGA